MESMEISGFRKPVSISVGNLTKLMYVSRGSGKPVIVMHELPGMTPSFIRYCSELSLQGFRVYMPLLFKSPNTEMNSPQIAVFCISREFRDLFTVGARNRDRVIVQLLDKLIRHASEANPDQPIGVIGMCLTGGFSVAGIVNENVNAAVCCQPSYPFIFNIDSIGLSSQRREEVAQKVKAKIAPCVKSYRYRDDTTSKPKHVKAIADLLGSHFTSFPDLDGDGHSTVTGDQPDDRVKQDIIEFLKARL